MDTAAHPAALAVTAAVADAANILRVPIEAITVEYLEARDWPDSCLGLPRGDEACADVVTPGYLIGLGEGLTYRADRAGNVRRDPSSPDRELVVYFRQSGGIGGWSSEYYADDSSLSPDDAAHIRAFIDEVGFFDLPRTVVNGEPIRDGYRYTLFLAHGRRNHQVSTYDGSGPHESATLDRFIDWLRQRAPAPHPRPMPVATQ